MNIVTFDLETTTKKSFGRIANPLDKDNKIVAIGLKYYNPGCDEKDLGRLAGHIGEYSDQFPLNWLNYCDFLVGHNIKFDLLYIWEREDLQQWFKDGGRIWDTQLAHFILSEQQEQYPALRDIAVRCYGCDQRTKQMEEYWKQGIDTKDIPKELVIEDVMNDVKDTENIFFKQLQLANNKGMLLLIELQMDALLATTEIEYNGVYTNKDILYNNKAELVKVLEEKTKLFLDISNKYWIHNNDSRVE